MSSTASWPPGRRRPRWTLRPAGPRPGPDQGTGNFFGYSNPELDDLLKQVAATPDLERTRVLLSRAQRLIVADHPVTFLYEGRQVVALSRRLENATPNAASVFFGMQSWELRP